MKEIIYIKFKGKRGITYSSMDHNYWKEFISVKVVHTDILWLFRLPIVCTVYFSCVTFKVYIVNPNTILWVSTLCFTKRQVWLSCISQSLNQSRENSCLRRKLELIEHILLKLSSVGTQQPAVRDASLP